MEAKGTRLVKRPETGIWYIVQTGNSRGHSTGTRDRKAAEKALARAIQTGDLDEIGDSMTVHQILDDYEMEHVKQRIIGKETATIAMGYFRNFIGDRYVATLTELDFDDPKTGNGYIQLRRTRGLRSSPGREPKPAKDGTILRELGVFAAALNNAVRKKRLRADQIPTIPRPAPPPPKDRWLTAEEEARLIATTGEPSSKRLSRIYRFLVLALDTAARKEAMQSLTWFQVDFEARMINLNPPGRAQTKKRRPMVPMSDRLHAMLKRAWDERKVVRSEADGNKIYSAYVLDHPGAIRRSLETITTKAGLHDVTAHVFRHTWCTRAARAGVSMREIADFVGDDVRTIERVYYSRTPDYLKSAADWRQREARDRTAIQPVENKKTPEPENSTGLKYV